MNVLTFLVAPVLEADMIGHGSPTQTATRLTLAFLTGAPINPPLRNAILNLVAEDDAIDEISQIEAHIEALAGIAERCRKIIMVSKLAIVAGIGLMFAMMLGLFGSDPVTAIGSIAAVLGGIVSLGSNVSTLRQTTAAITTADARRSELIGGLDLRVVGDEATQRT